MLPERVWLVRPNTYSLKCLYKSNSFQKYNGTVYGLEYNEKVSSLINVSFKKIKIFYMIVCALHTGSNLFVKWCNTNHEGTYPLEWLKDNDYWSEERRRNRHKRQEPLIAVS